MRSLIARVVVVSAVLTVVSPGGASAQAQSANTLPVLTRIADIRALSQDAGGRGYPVRIRGTVTHFDEIGHATLIVHDGAFGQFVAPPINPASVRSYGDLKAGDLVEIEGRTIRGGFAPNVLPSKVRLGRGPLLSVTGVYSYQGGSPPSSGCSSLMCGAHADASTAESRCSRRHLFFR